jgi:hypothetical protein
VVKLTRVEKLPAGLELYRGLGGSMALPERFYRGDGNGCRGYTEWGLLSTTSDRATAVEVSCLALRARMRIHCTPCYSMSESSAATACTESVLVEPTTCIVLILGQPARLQYSGAGKDKPLPTLLVTVTGAIDRGARIAELSQYPGEVSETCEGGSICAEQACIKR